MKIFCVLVFAILFLSCKTSTVAIGEVENVEINGDCVENLTFKKSFLYHVEIVDSLMNNNAQRLRKNSSLLFISKYTHVSAESMLNYAEIYPTISYEKDRKGWINWYEQNKCKNIRFRN